MVTVTYEQLTSDVAKWIEAVGAGIMVGGGLLALCKYALSMLQPGDPETGTGGSADSSGKRFSSASRCSSSETSSAPSSSTRP